MAKPRTLEQLKGFLGDIPRLRALQHGNGEFPSWKNRVLKVLGSAYGEDSAEVRRFVNAPGKAFIINTESGLRLEYLRQLESYEGVLQSLVGES